MKRHLTNTIVFLTCFNFLAFSQNDDQMIERVEKEYYYDCFQKDSCLSLISVYNKNGSYTQTSFVQYPEHRVINFYNSKGIWTGDRTVNGKDSMQTDMIFNDSGDLIKTVYTIFEGVPNKIYDQYINTFNSHGRLSNQLKVDRKGQRDVKLTYHYDTLGYSKVVYEIRTKDSTLISAFFYKNDKVVKQIESFWPNPFEFSYRKDGKMLFEDLTFMPQIRRFYFYKEDLLIKTEDWYRKKDGTVTNEIDSHDEYEYKFDNKNRPVIIIKTTYRNGKQVNKTKTQIEYK